MSYGFSASTCAFYVYEDMESYKKYGNWPGDVKPISDDVWEKYCVQGPPGKVRGADKNGLPCWIDAPKPGKEELIFIARSEKFRRAELAKDRINVISYTVELGIANDTETEQLKKWKMYRVLLDRVQEDDAPDINWPEVPAY